MARLVPFFVAGCIAFGPGTLWAQVAPPTAPAPAPPAPTVGIAIHQQTSDVPEGRFEIIQSTLGIRMTLRVDINLGNSWQLVQRPDGSVGWQQLLRLAHPEADVRVTNRANYQVFTSGIDLSFTFMINANTGATWQLKEDVKQGWFWDPIL